MTNMGRIRERSSVKKLFECFAVVEPPWANNDSPSHSADSGFAVTKSYFPSGYNEIERLKIAARFSFPCRYQNEHVEVFTFVLTGGDSSWTFGYCRHPIGAKNAILFLSFLPWQEIFFRALNLCAEMSEENLNTFLQRLYATPVPDSGTCLYVPTHSKPFICPCPKDLSLPSIPENRNVSEFYNALSTESMIQLFAALLAERRIVVTSKKLSRLSAIVVACNSFLLPMEWQNIFIPVLPQHLQEYLSAPMPFLIGVPISVWDRIPAENINQVVHVDADSDTVTSPFIEDVESMPTDVINSLRKNLSRDKVLGDGLARAFLRALAQLMGHYQDAIRDDATFDEELFVQFAHPHHRPYLKTMLNLQMFKQFRDNRVEQMQNGSSVSDEFEIEALTCRSLRANPRNGISSLRISSSQNKAAIKKAGKAVMSSVKRESGSIIESVKQNSTLKSAYRSVKESGKSVKQKSHVAYSDIKSKFHVPTPFKGNTDHSTDNYTGKMYRRHPPTGASSSTLPTINVESSTTCNGRGILRNTDDNFIHLMSSPSASNINETSTEVEKPNPRLSKSEENLIDLDTPDELPVTLENPLYELAAADSEVFSESAPSSQELLKEYGLDVYFSNLGLNTNNGGARSSLVFPSNGKHNLFAPVEQAPSSSNGATNATNWATFD